MFSKHLCVVTDQRAGKLIQEQSETMSFPMQPRYKVLVGATLGYIMVNMKGISDGNEAQPCRCL